MEKEKMIKALADENRFKIFNCLIERKHCVRSLAKKLDISEPAVSQHLKILKDAGLVYGEKYGYHMHYQISSNALDNLITLFSKLKEKSLKQASFNRKCQCEYKEMK